MDGLPSLGHKPGLLGEAPKNHDHDDHGHNDDEEESGWMDCPPSDTSQARSFWEGAKKSKKS